MKKLIIILLTLIMLTGCTSDKTNGSSDVNLETTNETTTETTVETTTETTLDTTSETTQTVTENKVAETTAPQTKAQPPQTTKPVATQQKVKPPVVATQQPVTTVPSVVTTQPQTTTQQPGNSNSNYKQAVLDLVNAERAKAGLNSLTMLDTANAAAQVRATEIIGNFSHTRPDGTSCFTALDQQGVNYRTCGENIASGQRTPGQVMESWMNSAGHKANILNPQFTQIGIGYVEGGGYGTNWVQLFVG